MFKVQYGRETIEFNRRYAAPAKRYRRFKLHSLYLSSAPMLIQGAASSHSSPVYPVDRQDSSGRPRDDKESRHDSDDGPDRSTASMSNTIRALSRTKPEFPEVGLSSQLTLPQLSPDTTERIFPISSVVTLDSSPSLTPQTPFLESPESSAGENALRVVVNADIPGDRVSSTSPDDAATVVSGFEGSTDTLGQRCAPVAQRPALVRRTSKPELSLSRIKSIKELPSVSQGADAYDPGDSCHFATSQPSDNSGRKSATDRASERRQYTATTIQSFGVLVAVQEIQGKHAVQVVSQNSRDIIGYSPSQLFEVDSIFDILPRDQRDSLRTSIDSLQHGHSDVERSGSDVLSLAIATPEGITKEFWCTMHMTRSETRYTVLELEPEHYPVLCANPTPQKHRAREQPSLSTSDAQALEGLEDFRSSRRQSDCTTIVRVIAQIQQSLATTCTLEDLRKRTVNQLRALTGFTRVVVYKFDDNGKAEPMHCVNCSDSAVVNSSQQEFLRPKVLEKLHNSLTRNKMSISYDRAQTTTRLVFRNQKEQQIDMTFSYLSNGLLHDHTRSGESPPASISIGIRAFGKVWGAAVCEPMHPGMRITPVIQRICWLMSDMISTNVERLSNISSSQDVQDANTPAASLTTPTQGDQHAPQDILGLFNAHCAASSISGETKMLGKPCESQEVLVLMEYMRMKQLGTVLVSTDIVSDLPGLNYSPGFKCVTGVLFVPLTSDGADFIMFFRMVDTIECKSAESPRPPPLMEMPSFHQPSGVVAGGCNSQQWTQGHLNHAFILSTVFRTFTETLREKEATMRSTQLMRLLLANSAHEFRTPLNAIINYLELALDGPLAQETREILSRSHSASKSLVYIINDLLDLTNAENGQCLIKDEVFDLSETVDEAADIFGAEAKQKKFNLYVVQHSDLPLVLGDQRRVRQVITNLISNAVQHTTKGAVTVEISIIPGLYDANCIGIEVAIHDTGSGMPTETVEALFCELEQVCNQSRTEICWNNTNQRSSIIDEDESVLGLGLALVARIVRNMDGQLTVKSEEGKGSCFRIRLKFPLPSDHQMDTDAASPESSTTPTEDNCRLQLQGEDQNDQSKVRECRSPGGSDALEGTVSLETTTTASNPCPHQTLSPDLPEDEKAGLHLLIAEDDPINSTIVKKRLEKSGHTVHMTSNGKECASAYCENPQAFDAALMDLQMPIVDGLGATKMIRDFEKSTRIPIFAVSASLLEKDHDVYVQAGFDGWIMKPIDFQRVNHLLKGIRHEEVRQQSTYCQGKWEDGGWFKISTGGV